MISACEKIVLDILMTFYQAFWFSSVFAVIFMFLYLYAEDNGGGIIGIKAVFHKWRNAFVKNSKFRRIFFLSFYTTMVLFRTLINRDLWLNPLSAVNGGWTVVNSDGSIDIAPIENFLMLMPFSILFLMVFHDHLLRDESLKQYMLQSLKCSFLFSLSIETAQLVLRLGTFQFSDLVLNTIGGIVSVLVYWCFRKIRR